MYSSKLFFLFLLLFGSLFQIAIAHPSAVSGYTTLEPAIVSVQVRNQAEEGADGTFVIQLSSPLEEEITLYFSLTGTATLGEDYSAPGESVAIPAGETSVPVSISAVADELIEYDETVILTLLNPDNEAVQLAESPGYEAEMIIINIGKATAEVRVLQHTGEGSAEPGKFEITLDKAVHSNVNVEYSLSGTATSGEDFEVFTGLAFFQAGEVSSILTVNAIDDEIAEGTETIELLLEQTDHPYVEVENSAENQLLEIIDNDPVGDPVKLTVMSGEDAEEENINGSFIFELERELDDEVTVEFTMSGSATETEDYQATGGTITIPANATRYSLPIAVLDDDQVEGPEAVILTITNIISDGMVEADPVATEAQIAILDNDESATLSVFVEREVSENETSGGFVISSSVALAQPVTIRYLLSGTALAGKDYNSNDGDLVPEQEKIIVLEANSATVSLPIVVVDDELVEEKESIKIELLGVEENGMATISEESSSAQLEISDNDAALISVQKEQDGAEGGSTAIFRISSTTAIAFNQTIVFHFSGAAEEGTDFTFSGGGEPASPKTVVLEKEQTDLLVNLTVEDDAKVEGSENVVLSLQEMPAEGAVSLGEESEAVLSIVDNDVATLSVGVEQEGSEDSPEGMFRILSSGALQEDVTIKFTLSGTATEVEDFTIPEGVLLANNGNDSERMAVLLAGATSLDIPLMIEEDELVEENETIRLSLLETGREDLGLSPAASFADMTILDNDEENLAPIADAGENQTIPDADRDGEEEVTLDGSGSNDEDGSIENYSWSIDGEEIAAEINPKVILATGTHTITLTVTDDQEATDTDEVEITINTPENQIPTANAGADQIYTDSDRDGIETISLDGSDSSDPDGTISSYSWSVEGGETVTGVNPSLDLGTGTHTITLTVTDDQEATTTDDVEITINAPANVAPVPNAGNDQTIIDTNRDGLESITLDGSGSTDEDGTINSYSWSIGGEEVATGVNPSLELEVGNYTITLTVTDDQEASDTDEVGITINAPENQIPTANAGNDQTVTDTDRNGTESITLDGSGSADEDGSIEYYSWSVGGEERATGVSPTIDLEVGTHIITLTVKDDQEAIATDKVEITINAPANQSPTASAGNDKTITDSDRNGMETVALDGSGSSDPDGTITAYSWSIGGEEVATGVNPSLELEVGTYTIQLKVTDDGNLSATDDVKITINTPANQPPIANAGNDQTIVDADRNGEEKIVLDGSDSSDAEGRIVSYSWRIAGVEKATGAKPTLTLPQGDTTVELEVKDDGDLTDTDEVKVVVNAPANQHPTANAGEDRIIQDTDRDGEEEVTLDGSGSSDPDGSIESYSWSIGDEVIATGINPKVTLATGTHTITLTVTDDQETTATDDVEITINTPENQAPTANAGNDQTLTDTDRDGEETVTLNGSGSSDPDGTITSYSWRVGGVERATGMNTSLNLATGTHTVTLTVTDNNGGTDSDELKITINTPANVAPVANAGNDQTVTDTDRNGKERITLNGSGSTDEDGSISSYSWSVNGVVMATGVNPGIDLGVGTHTVILTVTDNDDAVDTDEVKITVNAPSNESPTANAGPDQTLTDTDRNGFESVTLDGSGSSDPDGRIASFSWRINGDEKATGEKPTIVLERGTYTVVLVVTDNNGAEARDEVKITVNALDNQAPSANAGADQVLTDSNRDGEETVSLNGSASEDPDGNIQRYSWSIDGVEVAQGATPFLVLPVGTHTIVLTVTDDGGLTASDQVTISIRQSAVVSIASGSDGSEGGANGSFVLSSSMALNQDITVRYSLGGTAEAGSDFTSPGAQVVLRAGETSVTIPIQVIDDEEVEREETVVLTLTGVSGSQDVVLGEARSATISINDNEGCFTIREELLSASCSGTADGRINLTLTGASDNVTFAWSNGFAGEDLQNVPAGDYSVEVTDQVSGCRLVREYTLEVEDNTPPLAKARRVSISLNQTGQASLQAQNLNDGSTDNCGIKAYSVSKTSFSCTDIGENEVTFTVEDVNGNTASTRATVVVEDNLAPVFVSNQQFSISEDAATGSQVGVVEATDNCQSIAWEIVAGNDDGLFGINQEGQITTLAELDYERRISYNLTIRARAGGLQAIEVVSVMLLNVDEAGPDIGTVLEGDQSVQEDGIYSFEIPADAFEVPENEEISYSVQGLPSWMTFNENTLRLEGTPGNEDVGVYQITIRGTDSQGLYAEQSFSLEVGNTNDAPHSLTLSRNQVQENQPVGTFIGHLTHEDVDTGDAHTYHFASGEGDKYNSYFSLNGADLLTAEVLDYETDTLVTIRLAVTDRAGASFEEVFRIEVGNDENGAAFLPNLFSPNGDNMNDYFVLKASRVQELHWRIYNRQGRLVYETRDVGEATQTGWDGSTSGEPQPEGSYMWVLEAYYQDGSPLLIDNRQKGNVTLIR